MMGLTYQQQRLLLFIQTHMEEQGVCPSYEEMRRAIGVGSKSNVSRLLDALEEKGRIRRHYGRARTIEVIPEAVLLHKASLEQLIAELHGRGALFSYIIGGEGRG